MKTTSLLLAALAACALPAAVQASDCTNAAEKWMTACGDANECTLSTRAVAEACWNEPMEAIEEDASNGLLGGPTCHAACKVAANAAKLACKLQKKSHRERCKENVGKTEQACLLACTVLASPPAAAEYEPITEKAWATQLTEEEYQGQFSTFVKSHRKKYTADEFFLRYNIFKANLNKIRAHNAEGKASFTMAVNEFADLTFAEFTQQMTGYKHIDQSVMRAKNTEGPHLHLSAPLAQSLDWRKKNAVTPVKNQQRCGSCWAFSATGSIEGMHSIAKGDLPTLSEQQLVDCATAQGNHGCNGGLMDYAFQYVISNKGITSEDQYPYKAADGVCKKNVTSVSTIKSFVDVASYDEKALMAAVNIGPVSIAIQADKQCFQFYSGGVLDDPSCGTSLNHGVLLVGYGTDSDSGKDYWIVKNSWGSTWGDEGYIRFVRGKNQCGLTLAASYAVV